MLTSGFNHVAVLTQDTERFHTFYREVFGATVFADQTISDGDEQGRRASSEADDVAQNGWPERVGAAAEVLRIERRSDVDQQRAAVAG